MKNRGWFVMLGHTKVVAIVGIVVSIFILVLMPQFKWFAGISLGFVLLHIVVLLVLSLSVVVVLPQKVIKHFTTLFNKKEDQKFNAGWSLGWMNGFWVLSLVFLAGAIHIYLSFPNLDLLSFFLFLISLNFFIGNLVIRSAKHSEYIVLPWIDLFTAGNTTVMDAGCGAGRTSVALSKIYPGKIIAFDLFNSDYIEGGGNTLLEKNLKLTGILERVDIVKGDITQTHFKEGTFDAVVSSFMIDHLGNQKLNALKEINKILKTRGRLLMIVLTPNLSSFAILNILSFFLTSRKQWKKLFVEAEFKLIEEGEVNGGTYFLIEK